MLIQIDASHRREILSGSKHVAVPENYILCEQIYNRRLQQTATKLGFQLGMNVFIFT